MLGKLEARVLLSIKKNLTFINVRNLTLDWPDCQGEQPTWESPLRTLVREKHIQAFEAGLVESGQTRLTPVTELNFSKHLVFSLSPSGEGLLGQAAGAACGEPMPTLVHDVTKGTWNVIR